jgi:SAM-dependent methyltransferase
MQIKYVKNRYKTPTHCHMCGHLGDNQIAVITSIDHNKHQELILLKCANCGTLYYAGDDPVIGYLSDEINSTFWHYYTQVGAGLTGMLEPLFALGKRAQGNLLDVGCGFGYVTDFWNKIKYGNAVGLEKASYGRIGSELLGVTIHPKYYSECGEIRDVKYSIVYSSEVLEHIANPKEFIIEITKALADNGILVLTTPSSDAVSETVDPSTVIGALSPYLHYFVASANALEELLKDCGYKYIKIHNSGTRLFGWASRKQLPTLEHGKINWDDYFTYLNIISKNDDPNVKSGALYRLFKDSWNTGRIELAREAFYQFEQVALDSYNLLFRYPDIKRYSQRKSPIDDSANNPAWYGCALLFGGMFIGQHENDKKTKARMIEAAVDILRNESENPNFSQFSQEAQHFYPYAMKQLLVAYTECLHQEIKKVNHFTAQELGQLKFCITQLNDAILAKNKF